MSEHLTDSNILQSKKIYGSCKNSTILPVCSENSGSFSANVEDLCTERKPESAASNTSCTYSKNNNPKDVNSEFCLFSDEVTDYISGSADSPQGQISSFLETASSCSNYQRTRKNLKKQLNNEPNNSKEIFKSPLHEENSKSVADGELKSARDFKNLKDATFSVKQNSLLSKNSRANHTRIDVTSSDESVDELPQKSIETSTVQLAEQIRYCYGKFENPLIHTPVMPFLELVKRFSAGKNQPHARNNPYNEKIKECESKETKKKLVRNGDASPKRISFRKKTLNSSTSVRKSSKNANGAKTASKAVQGETIKVGKKILKKYVSKNKFVKNNAKGNLKLSITRTAYKTRKIQSDRDEKLIDKLPFAHSKDDAIQNQFLNNKNPIRIPPVSQETTPFCACRVNASVANNRSIQNDNQAASYGNFEHLTISGPSTSSNNNSCMNPVYGMRKRSSFVSLGISAQQFANDYFEKTEDTCILKKKDIAEEIFSRHTSLRDLTVSEFCNNPTVTNIFSDYLKDYVGIPANFHDSDKGYEFPENFETENLLSVAKDFIQSVISYIIPNDGPRPSNVSYLRIMNAAMSKMSLRETAIIAKIFKKKSSALETFKLDDVLSRLNFVGFLVIFDEYKRRQITSNMN